MRRALALAFLATSLLAGCPERRGGDARTSGIRTYTVRGELTQPPTATPSGRTILVRHEAIDDFVDATGATVGMAAMVMHFELAPAVPTADLRPGDKLELTVSVGWSPPVLRVDALRKLPPETALEFRAARPPKAR